MYISLCIPILKGIIGSIRVQSKTATKILTTKFPGNFLLLSIAESLLFCNLQPMSSQSQTFGGVLKTSTGLIKVDKTLS